MVLFKYVREPDSSSSSGEFANPTRIVVESDAVTLDQLMEDFKAFALSLGYHPSSVNQIQYIEPEEQSEAPEYGDGY